MFRYVMVVNACFELKKLTFRVFLPKLFYNIDVF